MAYPGMVYLVGAGPGDPELLTVKAKRLIEDADVILYDYLVHPSLLSTTKAVLVCVGKKKGKHSKKQSEIHDLLKHYAEQGHRVVRLKGGDPMVFGRVGEEMQFLQNNDIAYTVVPGVSSALAVPAYAGIPVTHRELSRSVAFVTGTLSTGGPTLDHHIPEADTLVILMSVTHLGTIVDKLLLQSRFSSETPVALIYSGTTSDQKCLMGTLSTIEEKQRQVQFKSPSLLIVGEVVPLSDTLNWVDQFPLFGQRVFFFRASHQSEGVMTQLRDLGADVIHVPLMGLSVMPDLSITEELLASVTSLVFTSANGVNFFLDQLYQKGLDCRLLSGKKLIVVGNATADALEKHGFFADLISSKSSQEGVLDAILSQMEASISEEHFLLPLAKNARSILKDGLSSKAASVCQLPLYESVALPIPEFTPQISGEDFVIFSSAEMVASFFASAIDYELTFTAFCLGPLTRDAFPEHFTGPILTSLEPSFEALIDLIVDTKNNSGY